MAKKVVSKKKVEVKKPIKKVIAKAPSPKASAKPVKAKIEKKSAPVKATPKKAADLKPEAPSTMSKASVKITKSVTVKVTGAKQVSENTDKIKIDRDSMTDEQIKWAEMYNKYKDTQASSYDMKATFQAASPLMHKVLGWGWIVSNENDRLEVLFKDGKRMLISNYRG